MNAEPVFYHKNGDLWYRDWCWGSDDMARARMRQMAVQFEGEHPDKVLAAECRTALAEYDAYWEKVDA